MRAAAAALAAGALLAAGCAGSGDAPRTTSTQTTTAAPGTGTPRPGQPTPTKLRSALLTATDVGAGWTEITLPLQGAKLCGIVPLKAVGTTKVRAEFGRVNSGEVIQHGVTAYPDGGASTSLTELRGATTGCGSYRVTAANPSGGGEREYRIAVATAALPEIGDERVGLRLTLRNGPSAQTTLYGVTRRDDLVAAITVTGPNPDAALFRRLVTLADRRLLILAGG